MGVAVTGADSRTRLRVGNAVEGSVGEQLAWNAGCVHFCGEFFNFFRVLCGEVLGFADVVFEMVEFDGTLGILGEVVLDDFPISCTQGAASALFLEFPVEEFVGGLCALAGEGGEVGDALDVFRRLDAGGFTSGG